MPLVEKRYAEALVSLSAEKNSLDDYQNELAAVAGIYEAESELKAFLLNPQNVVDVKKKVLGSILEGKVRQDILHLLFILLDKGRIGSLPGIYREYVRMADEKRNLLNITIMAATPVDQEHIDRIGEKFRKLYHSSSVKVAVKLDPTLVGGVKVAVGDKLYDGTIKGRLSRLQSILAGQ